MVPARSALGRALARRLQCQLTHHADTPASTVHPVDVNWWAVALPSTITAVAAFAGVLAGQWFTRRRDKREAVATEFRWMISLVGSSSPEAQTVGKVLVKDALDHPERWDTSRQAQIIAIWAASFPAEVAAYDEDDTIEIVDDEPEA